MGLINSFRKINDRLNERCFNAEANTYRPYLTWVDRYLPPAGVIIDVGAGSVSLEDYLPRAGEDNMLLIAVDGQYDGLASNRTRLRIVANAESLPFRDKALDAIAASCVLEHIEHPTEIVSECYRVLKKGGAFMFYTPNRRSYVAAIARITPLSFHRWIRMLQTGKSYPDVEVCKTHYKMNTLSDVLRHRGKFCIISLETHIGAPCYTTFMPPPVHLIFIAFHKILQRVTWLRRTFGEVIIGCLVKS